MTQATPRNARSSASVIPTGPAPAIKTGVCFMEKAARSASGPHGQRPGGTRALFPKSDECTAEDNKHSANDNRGGGRASENDQVDHLPHHKQDRYVETDNAAKLDWREVERQAVAKEKG